MDLFASLYLEGICKDKRLNADLKLKSSCIHNQWNKKAEGNEFVTKTRCLLTDELTSISRATFQKEKTSLHSKHKIVHRGILSRIPNMDLQFWAIWAVRENSSISLKYLTFEGNFYMFILANRFLLNDVAAALKSCVT